MAFLFKSKKNQDREKDRVLTSREGPPPPGSQQSSTGSIGARIAKEEKNPLQRATPTGSLASLDIDGTNSPDHHGRRQQHSSQGQNQIQGVPQPQGQNQSQPQNQNQSQNHEPSAQQASDLQFRNGPGPAVGNTNMSLYPWSQRRLTYTSSTISPFPRYGASVNATASKEGDIYVMGGLINSQTVKGDLWLIEAGGNMSCYQLATTAEGPTPRVGHASLLVGNAFIVYGGDTKIDESDVLDETLYLLNTSTRQWSRALPAGPRPSGRYGHSLNILGSKIYIFGGQVEGYFMNDLAAFDLNQLQMSNNRWEILIPNESSPAQGNAPPARTNHSMVSYNDKMYLFGGTNGFKWFNDVWCYDPITNAWTQLDCIGYIPVEREGHAAALVDDVMYVFGGRTEEGADLGDLAAFRITSRRWYTFQNMGPSPSPRSGHSMTTVGKSIAVLGGEPSSATAAVNDLALIYMLDTNKIRYPNDSQASNKQQSGPRRPSDASRTQSREGSQGSRQGDHKRMMGPGAVVSPPNGVRSPPNGSDFSNEGSSSPVNGSFNGNSKLPRAAGPSPPATAPPQGQPPRPTQGGPMNATRTRNPSIERSGYSASPVRSNSGPNQSPVVRDDPKGPNGMGNRPPQQGPRAGPKGDHMAAQGPMKGPGPDVNVPPPMAGPPPSGALPGNPKSKRQPGSMDSTSDHAMKIMANRPASPPPPTRQGSGYPMSRRLSGRNSQTVAVLKELDAARNRNAWYASELELARKAGYVPNTNMSPLLDGRVAETFNDDDRPLIEALLAMRTELANVQASVDKQAVLAAKQISEAESQRDVAIQEAVYAKAKLAAHVGGVGGSVASTPHLDGEREATDRTEMSRKLANALAMQRELQAQVERVSAEIEAEKRARKLADDTLTASERRMGELEAYKQQTSYEMERLRAELHNAQHEAREQSSVAADAAAAIQLLQIEKEDFERQYKDAAGSAKEKGDSFDSLREAMMASAEMKNLLEQKLDHERAQREATDAKLVQIKAELEARTVEVVTLTQRLHDAEELAEKHAQEARAHQQVVLSGLDKMQTRDVGGAASPVDAERVVALQSQLEAARALVKRHQQDADAASDKLRSAEERIAGLEAYQEQASREGVTIRRQLQGALRETQTLQALNGDLKHQLANQQLETNAVTVQHNTLKDILLERGISPTSSGRMRGSPREGSPEQGIRIRGLEQQLAQSMAAHEETKQTLVTQVSESEAAYRDKLAQLENDYQSAVHYVKGTEKMLKQLQEQLTRYKAENGRLKAELEEVESRAGGGSRGIPGDWESERHALSDKIEALQADLEVSKVQLGKQLQVVRQELEEAKRERDAAVRSGEETTTRLEAVRRDYDKLQQESVQLERRAEDAEKRVGLLLDQVESSVGNYRRRSRQVVGLTPEQLGTTGLGGGLSGVSGISGVSGTSGTTSGGASLGHVRQESSEAGSAYGDARNSAALDSLANELETLRSHWEATNKNYRLSNAFDFETNSINGVGNAGVNNTNGASSLSPHKDGKDDGGMGLSESLADWRKRLDS